MVGTSLPRRSLAEPLHSSAQATLTMASLATLLVLMNFTAPVSALSETAGALKAGSEGQTWILGGISLGLAALLLVAGSLADNYGRRRVFVLGAVGLGLSSVICALAPTTILFVLGRVTQGGASAALLASSLGLVAHVFPAGPERARATGIWGAMIGGGIALGPVFSALVTTLAGWRTTYWVLAVLALSIGVITRYLVAESRGDHRRRLDLLGALTLGTGVAFFVAALTSGRDGWTRPSVVLFFAAAVALLAGFVVVEQRGMEPMLDLRLLREPAFTGATIGALVTGVSVIGFMTYIPTYTQRVFGFGPLASAGVLAIWSGVSFFAALRARRLNTRIAIRHQVALGLALCGVGELTVIGITERSSWWWLVPGLAVAGAGTGLVNATLAGLAVHAVPPDRAAMGSGANNTARYVGSSLGIAIVAAVLALVHGNTEAQRITTGMGYAASVAALIAFAGAFTVALCTERSSVETTRRR